MINNISDIFDGSLVRECTVHYYSESDKITVNKLTGFLAIVEMKDVGFAGPHLIFVGPEIDMQNLFKNYAIVDGTELFVKIPKLVNYSKYSVDNQCVGIFEIPSSFSTSVPSLHSLFNPRNVDAKRVVDVVGAVSTFLEQWSCSEAPIMDGWKKDSLYDYLFSVFANDFTGEDNVYKLNNKVQQSTQRIFGLDLSVFDSLLFEGHNVVFPNPLYYVLRPDAWKEKSLLLLPIGGQIGNLSISNILLADKNGENFFILDLSLYHQGLIFGDYFQLEIDLLLNTLQADTNDNWLDFVALCEGLFKELDLTDKPSLSNKGYVIWDVLTKIRASLIASVTSLAANSKIYSNLITVAWVSAYIAGVRAFFDKENRYNLSQRKAAYFYAACALQMLLPHSSHGKPEFDATQLARLRVISEDIGRNDLVKYFNWVISEGGATSRRFDAIETWYVGTDIQPIPRQGYLRHYDDWNVDLEEQHGIKNRPLIRKRIQGLEEIIDFIAQNYRIVLLGEPGSGKTTLIERLFIAYASKTQNDQSLIPILVRLNGFNGEKPFHEYLIDQMGELGPYYEKLKDKIILLCDGLNEMSYLGPDGRSLVDEVRTFLENEIHHWILSCRIKDYVSQQLSQVGGNVMRIEILPLNLHQIKTIIQLRLNARPELFTSLWGELCGGSKSILLVERIWSKFETHSEENVFWDWRSAQTALGLTAAPGYITELELVAWRKMHERKLMSLCRNPYMLKLIFKVFLKSINQGKDMPSSQGQIFHEVINGLLEDEIQKRNKAFEAGYQEQVFESLQSLAFMMQSREQVRHTETEILLTDAVNELEGKGFLHASSLIDLAVDSQILIYDGKRIRFSHQLMQEYFASTTLLKQIQHSSAKDIWNQEKWWQPSHLDQTAIILTGWYHDWENVVKWISEANPELAIECMVRNEKELTQLSNDTRIYIRNLIKEKSQNSTSFLERAAAFRALGWFGDDRFGVGTSTLGIPEIVWGKPVEPGVFKMGGDPYAFGAWAGLEIDVPYTYFVSQYPVTVAQFASFIKDGGYSKKWRDCWTDDGWKWKEKWKRESPYKWNDPFWSVPNHPVIGVTWFESYAFSKWLHNKYLERKSLPDPSLEIRLPTEIEWEKAARGADARKYPWGEDMNINFANIYNNPDAIQRTTAVGLYNDAVASVYGISDLSGNVWEWCISEWEEQFRPRDLIKINTDTARACRGGSWSHDQFMARSATRFWYRPGIANISWGFRVCASIKLSVM